ncbi:MAG: ABC transporter ATP-binding protein [Acidobacteriota bacterium]|nr:ABC transporter ATP-binding protein [Acidobacteriota bacterium]
MSRPLLEARDLRVEYVTGESTVLAIDRVELTVEPGEILGIAGESGSGKSTLAKAVMRILPPPGVITGGRVEFEGKNLLDLSESELESIRWKRISMVFQSAMDSLNPVITVGEQIEDTIRAHTGTSRSEARERARELLDLVGMDPERVDSYAHQLSGGMRQRVGIALALALEPSLVILDEPTTALDVIVEREILAEIRALQRRRGFAVLFITHDLERMLQISDRIAVFYAARLAELGPAREVRESAKHPYTQDLLRAFPRVRGEQVGGESIGGTPPSLARPPSGCRFHPRCPIAVERCGAEQPEWREITPGHWVACHLAE